GSTRTPPSSPRQELRHAPFRRAVVRAAPSRRCPARVRPRVGRTPHHRDRRPRGRRHVRRVGRARDRAPADDRRPGRRALQGGRAPRPRPPLRAAAPHRPDPAAPAGADHRPAPDPEGVVMRALALSLVLALGLSIAAPAFVPATAAAATGTEVVSGGLPSIPWPQVARWMLKNALTLLMLLEEIVHDLQNNNPDQHPGGTPPPQPSPAQYTVEAS